LTRITEKGHFPVSWLSQLSKQTSKTANCKTLNQILKYIELIGQWHSQDFSMRGAGVSGSTHQRWAIFAIFH